MLQCGSMALFFLFLFLGLGDTALSVSLQPPVFRHSLASTLSFSEANNKVSEAKAVCESLEGIMDMDIKVSAAVPLGHAVMLPCIYCGAYIRQRKYWHRSNYTNSNPWNATKINATYLGTFARRDVDPGEKVYVRQDNSLIVNNFEDSDMGLYFCNHSFAFDTQQGKVVYNLYPVPDPSPSVVTSLNDLLEKTRSLPQVMEFCSAVYLDSYCPLEKGEFSAWYKDGKRYLDKTASRIGKYVCYARSHLGPKRKELILVHRCTPSMYEYVHLLLLMLLLVIMA